MVMLESKMITESMPREQEERFQTGVEHKRSERTTLPSKDPARRSPFARRVTKRLLGRIPSFTTSVTESESSVSTVDGGSSPPALSATRSETDGYDAPQGGSQRLSTIHSLRDRLDASEGDSADSGKIEDALAREVGLNAHEYLEECFYTEASVLEREKFDDVPEIIQSDFTITGRLGKGSFCDVFDVVCKGNQHLAMKCLRPQVRANAEQFTMGAEDLVHETAILANLSHRHIIKLYGRAAGRLTDTFVLNDGYFILLEKLNETLHDRLKAWKHAERVVPPRPPAGRMEVAHAVASAMAYLHSRNIVSRDLKPDNVGFDARGTMKLFDFGFAVGLPRKDAENPAGLLYDKCGTPRYMAPEVGLSLGYGTRADVYSFGILLWEMWALEQPFASITSPADFDRAVFREGQRPALGLGWPPEVKALLRRCWFTAPGDRPAMAEVQASLSAAMPGTRGKKSGTGSRKTSVMKTLRSKMTR